MQFTNYRSIERLNSDDPVRHTLTLEEEAKISAIRIFSGISNELHQVELSFERQRDQTFR